MSLLLAQGRSHATEDEHKEACGLTLRAVIRIMQVALSNVASFAKRLQVFQNGFASLRPWLDMVGMEID